MRVVAAAKHVLVIDDAEELRRLFRAILEEEGCRVSLVEVPPSLDELAHLAPDLILLDLLLGPDETTAWGFLEALRRDPRLATIPVLVCSAATQVLEQRKVALATLHAEIIRTPFDLGDLLCAVARCLHPGSAPATEEPLAEP